MKEQYGYVYRIYKKDNQKSYIGITMNIDERIGKHKRANVKNMAIHHAIRKYGWNAFNWEILERCSKESLMYRERIYISMLDTYKGFGYNQTPGGEHILFGEDNPMFGRTGEKHHRYGIPHTDEVKRKVSLSNTGYKHTDEAKRKISIAHTGRKHTKEAKENMSKAQRRKTYTKEQKEQMSRSKRGKNNPNYGKSPSKETREKISKANKGLKRSEETKKKMSISMKEVWRKRRNS